MVLACVLQVSCCRQSRVTRTAFGLRKGISMSQSPRRFRLRHSARLTASAAAVAVLALAVPAVAQAASATPAPAARSVAHTATKPTIVLVHGAWADASSFAPVTALLQRRGYTV